MPLTPLNKYLESGAKTSHLALESDSILFLFSLAHFARPGRLLLELRETSSLDLFLLLKPGEIVLITSLLVYQVLHMPFC